MTTIPADASMGVSLPSLGEALATQAYQVLRDVILHGSLLPGTRLSVPEFARQLRVSRTPAREAIARLTYEGLATFEPRRGAVVARISYADLREIYQVREMLEGLACRIAAERVSDNDVRELRRIVVGHRGAIEAADVERHMDIDQRFHQVIRRIAGNSRLTSSLDQLQGQIRLAMHTTCRSSGGMAQALGEHEEILAMVARRDPRAAEDVARRHVNRLYRQLGEAAHREERAS